jgi:hypothetical protein
LTFRSARTAEFYAHSKIANMAKGAEKKISPPTPHILDFWQKLVF